MGLFLVFFFHIFWIVNDLVCFNWDVSFLFESWQFVVVVFSFIMKFLF